MPYRLKRLNQQRLLRLNPEMDSDSGFTPFVKVFRAPYSAGDQTWDVPASGRYDILAWGPGGKGADAGTPGGSGAFAAALNVRLSVGMQVVVSVGPLPNSATDGVATTVTIPGRPLLSAGVGAAGSSGGGGGTASGGDVNIAGGAKTGSFTGGDAPSYGEFPGGLGGRSSPTSPATVPGGGGGAAGSNIFAAAGLVIIQRVA